jgi:hypothetical protein
LLLAGIVAPVKRIPTSPIFKVPPLESCTVAPQVFVLTVVFASVIAPGASGVVGKTSVTEAAVIAVTVGFVSRIVNCTVVPATALVTTVVKFPKVFCTPGCATDNVALAPVVFVPPLVVVKLGIVFV